MLSDSEDIEMYQDYMIDFLYDKRDKYKWMKLDIANAEKCCWHDYIINLEAGTILDLLTDKFDISKNVCLCDNLSFHYNFSDGPGSLLIRIPFFEAAIIKGKHLTRKTYLEFPTSIISQGLFRINTELKSKLNRGNNGLVYLLDDMLLSLNTGQRIK